jgi:hypothetical protein
MFDGVLGRDPYWDWQRDEPQAAPPRVPWPLIALLVGYAMLSIAAAVAFPEAFTAGLEQF